MFSIVHIYEHIFTEGINMFYRSFTEYINMIYLSFTEYINMFYWVHQHDLPIFHWVHQHVLPIIHQVHQHILPVIHRVHHHVWTKSFTEYDNMFQVYHETVSLSQSPSRGWRHHRHQMEHWQKEDQVLTDVGVVSWKQRCHGDGFCILGIHLLYSADGQQRVTKELGIDDLGLFAGFPLILSLQLLAQVWHLRDQGSVGSPCPATSTLLHIRGKQHLTFASGANSTKHSHQGQTALNIRIWGKQH